jgi:hypothetical protein
MMNDLLIQLLIYHCFINLEDTIVKVKMLEYHVNLPILEWGEHTYPP